MPRIGVEIAVLGPGRVATRGDPYGDVCRSIINYSYSSRYTNGRMTCAGGYKPAGLFTLMSSILPLSQSQTLPALSDLDLAGAERLARERGLPAYRGRQLHQALAQRGIWDIEQVSALPAILRRDMGMGYRTRTIEPTLHLTSKLDRSEKVLFTLHDGMTVESVLIRSRTGRPRETVCVSSQVGCPAACTFCATGLGGFSRNLTGSEIADQVMYFVGRLRPEGNRVTNVVFMGMGEPLL
ncbi:MAG: hypothetical protein M3Z66_21485, partial [Chloroflexota bacterium]|nr:hypothetical protein [Chloroflexota bacterium]